jgi:hypothetical protein
MAIWDKLPEESSKAYEAFCVYRDMGTERSLVKAGEKLGKSRILIEGWSAKYRWVERVGAYDSYLDQLKRKTREREILEMLERHIHESQLIQAIGVERLKRIKEKPEELSAHEAKDYTISGMREERLAYGLETERIIQEIQGKIEVGEGEWLEDEDKRRILFETVATIIRKRRGQNNPPDKSGISGNEG